MSSLTYRFFVWFFCFVLDIWLVDWFGLGFLLFWGGGVRGRVGVFVSCWSFLIR